MVYLMDNMGGCLQYFWVSFLVTFIIGGLEGYNEALWTLIFGFSIVFLHSVFPNFDYGMTNTLSKFLAAKAGKDVTMTADELATKSLLQVAGALVANLIWLEIGASELSAEAGQVTTQWLHAPTVNQAFVRPAEVDGGAGERLVAEVFFTFMIWHFIQLYFFNKMTGTQNGADLSTNLRVGMGYLMTITLMNVTYKNSIGGITLDLGRMLAAMIKYGNDYNTDEWWCLLFAPVAGYVLCLGWNMVEAMANKKGGDSGATAVNTEENDDNAA